VLPGKWDETNYCSALSRDFVAIDDIHFRYRKYIQAPIIGLSDVENPHY